MEITNQELESMMDTLHKMRRSANKISNESKSKLCTGMIDETLKELASNFKKSIDGAQNKSAGSEDNQIHGPLSDDESGIVGDVRNA